jgi:putative drug exporter of the RND superfamily
MPVRVDGYAAVKSRNLAARAVRWSASHRKTAVLGWILFVVLAIVITGSVGQRSLGLSEMGDGESKRGEQIVAAADFPEQVSEQVHIQGKATVKAGDPQITAAVKDVVSSLQRIDGVTRIESPLNARHGVPAAA